MNKTIESIKEVIGEVLQNRKIELVDIEYKRGKGKSLLRIFIDKEGGVNIGDCQEVSEEIEPGLKAIDSPNNYVLEVSSPGLDRPLKKEKDYFRFKGRMVKIRTFLPLEGQKSFRGRLEGLENRVVKIESEGNLLNIPLEKIAQARLEIEL